MDNNIKLEADKVIKELYEKAKLKRGDIVVIGCSTSEIVGCKIGTQSSPDVASIVFNSFYEFAKEKGFNLAFQCCEHLNRAIVIEKGVILNENYLEENMEKTMFWI